MKRIVAVLLTALLLISCLPLTAMAAKTDTAETAAGTERKFQLLLEDLELVDNVHRSDRYFYEELGQYPAKNPEWILIRGGLYDLSAKNNIKYQYATVGNKLLRANVNSSPFKLGYGIYDVKTGAFYDILDAWDKNLNNLRDTWDSLAPTTAYSDKDKSSENGMFMIGDADIDGAVTIMDATRIQRCIAELDENPWEKFTPTGDDFVRGTAIAGATDYDRDGSTTVMDATRIQRGIADLPNTLSAKIVLTRNAEDHGKDTAAQMINSHSAANKFVKSYTGETLHSALLPDDDFKTFMVAGVYLKLDDTADKLTLESAQIDSDGVLNLSFKAKAASKPNGKASPRLVMVQMPNTFIDDVKDIKVNVTEIENHPYVDYKLAWDKRIYEEPGESFEPKLLITDRNQLDADKRDQKQILDAYNSNFFKDRSLIALNIYLGSGSYNLTLYDVSLDKDGVLKVDFSRNHPSGVTDDINHRFVVIEIPKKIAERVKNIDVFIDNTFYQDYYRPAKHPYLYVQPAADDTREASLYTSRDQLDKGLKGHQQLLDDYDEHFFEHSAILTVHYYLPYETMLYEFSGIDVFSGMVRVRMKEMTPQLNHDPGVQVSYCFEVGKSWIADATNGTQVIHEPVAAGTSVFNENIKIHDRPAIPAGSYTKIGPLSEAYHKTLTDEVYSTALLEARGSGDTNGVAAIITNPPAMENMIHDPSLSTGYAGDGLWFYEVDKDYTFGYDLNFFDQYALVAIATSENANETLTINGMYKVGNTLYIDAELVCPTALAPMYHDCVTFVKIYKQDLEGVTAVSVGKLGVDPAADQPLASVVSSYHPDADRPSAAEAEAQGYRMIDSETVINGNYQATYGKNDVFNTITGDKPYGNEQYYGYMAVIKTPAQFKYIFPERDASEYNEAFFKTNALIVLVHRGYNYSDKIHLSHPAVKDGTLYGQLIYIGALDSEPMTNIYFDVHQVKLSDVKDVKQCALWDDPTYSRSYSMSPDYSKISEKTDIPSGSYHRLDVVSPERVEDYKFDVNMYYGLRTCGTLTFNPYQYQYFLNGREVPGVEGVMDNNAYLLINYVSKTNTATVKSVYTDGETLDVFLTESPAKNADGSRLIKTLQTLRLKKSDVNGIRSVRLYTGDPASPLLYAKIPPESQQMTIPECPWDQGYTKISSSVISMSVPDPYYFDLNGSPLDNDVYPGYVMLIKSRSELEKLLPGFDTEKKYDDTWFESYSIIGMLGYEEDGYGGHAEIGLTGVKDNTLYIEAGVKHPEYGDKEPTTTAMDIPIYTFRAVSKGYVKSVTDLKLWCGRANETGTVYTELPYWNQTPEMPLDPSAEGYKTLGTTPITVSSPAWNKFGFDSTPLGRPYMDTGYVVVIRSRAGFEKYLPGFDNEKKYDEEWFKTNAIVCALIQGNDYYSKAYLNNIAVKGNTLYASAGESYNPQYDENGVPYSLPVAPLVHKFLQVKQSDVANITAVSAWASPYPPYDTDVSFYVSNDHQPDGGSYSETNAGYHITKKDDVAKTIQKLYTGADGKPAERDDFTYNIEKFSNNSDFSYQSFIAMRVYQGSSMAKVTVDRVYRTGKNELTVDVTRQHESNTESPDSCWRMIIVRIGAYGKDFNIKLNVQDQEGTGIIANPVDYFSSNNSAYNDFAYSNRKLLDYERAFSGTYTLGTDVTAFTDIYGNQSGQIGFMATVRSLSQFNYLFPESQRFDPGVREKYNEEYFKTKALAVLVYRTANYEERINLNSLGVVGNTLYGAMTYTTPLAVSPMSVIKFDALEINRSDITDVTKTALWKKPYNEKGLLFKQYSGVDNVPNRPDDVSSYTALKTEAVGVYTVKDYINGLNPGFVTYPNAAVTFNRDQFKMITGTIDGLTITDQDFNDYMYYIVVANGTYAGDTAAINGVYLDKSNKAYIVDAAISAYQEDSGDPAPAKDKHTTIAIHRIKKSAIYNMTPNIFFEINTVTMWNSIHGKQIDGFRYEINDDGNAEIIKYVGSKTQVSVPDTLDGKKVVAIRDSAFEKNTTLKTLSIPRTVRSFGAKAAKDCSALESVYFANEVYPDLGTEIPPVENESIGASAFENCIALTSVALPDTIKTIGKRAFYRCAKLVNFALPASVTVIEDYTFTHCSELWTLKPNGKTVSVKTVGNYAFMGCESLEYVKFDDSLTSIGTEAFSRCHMLSEVTLGDNLTSIGMNAFLNCYELKSLTLPRSVTFIGKHALGFTILEEPSETEVYSKRDDFTIRGCSGSTAQIYATDNGLTFEAI